MLLDYTLLDAYISRHEADVTRVLSPASWVTLWHALASIHQRKWWADGGQPVSDAQWDVIDDWCNRATEQLFVDYEVSPDMSYNLFFPPADAEDQSEIVISDIPGGYGLLRVDFQLKTDDSGASDHLFVEVNGDDDTSYADFTHAIWDATNDARTEHDFGDQPAFRIHHCCLGVGATTNRKASGHLLFPFYDVVDNEVNRVVEGHGGVARGDNHYGVWDFHGLYDVNTVITSLRLFPVNGTQFENGYVSAAVCGIRSS